MKFGHNSTNYHMQLFLGSCLAFIVCYSSKNIAYLNMLSLYFELLLLCLINRRHLDVITFKFPEVSASI